jgi:hypothetical protein
LPTGKWRVDDTGISQKELSFRLYTIHTNFFRKGVLKMKINLEPRRMHKRRPIMSIEIEGSKSMPEIARRVYRAQRVQGRLQVEARIFTVGHIMFLSSTRKVND